MTEGNSDRRYDLVAAYFGIFLLDVTAAYFAWTASAGHPMWWYDALRGLVIFSCLAMFLIGYRSKGWWLFAAVAYAALAGIYFFGRFNKEQWDPINKITAIVLGATSLMPLGVAIITPIVWRIVGKDSAEPLADKFPDRPMTNVEAQEIYDQCLALMTDENRPKTFATAESLLPGGGFPAIVEALARVYCQTYPDGDRDAREHFESGVAIFALSAPDWTVRAEAAMLTRNIDEPVDAGVRQARSLASSLKHEIMQVNLEWGQTAFNERVEQLSK